MTEIKTDKETANGHADEFDRAGDTLRAVRPVHIAGGATRLDAAAAADGVESALDQDAARLANELTAESGMLSETHGTISDQDTASAHVIEAVA